MSRTGRSRPGSEIPANAKVVALDVSDAAAVAVFALTYEIDGLVHCAGVCEDGALRSRTPETLKKTFAPKAGGALKLGLAVDAARKAKGLGPLRFECFYSSVVTRAGEPKVPSRYGFFLCS